MAVATTTSTTTTRPRWRRALAAFGPGLLFAIASMGSSHFLLAPAAGAAFGYALAWTILVGHVVKYPAFEYAARYTVATGESLVEGVRSLPGPRNWAVWLLFAGIAAQVATIVAGVTAVCGAVLLAAFPSLNLAHTIVAVSGLAMTLLFFGAYKGLERVSVAILAVVVLLTVVAAVVARPDLGALAAGSVTLAVPAGAALLVGGLLGYMPAPLEFAFVESLWVAEKGVPADPHERRERMRAALLDFRIGYVVSILLGLLLLALGAALLAPRGLVPTGTAVFSVIAQIYRATLGDAFVPVYLVGAFLGMFATSYAVLDGFPRGMSAALTATGRPARRTRAGREPRYWALVYATFGIGFLVALLYPNPALLVNLAATGTVIMAPVWFLLILLVTHRLPDPWRPKPAARAVAWAGLAAMTAVTAFVAYVNFG